MIANKHRPARTIQLTVAWAVGVIGATTTAISLIPAVTVIASVGTGSSLGFVAALLVVSVMYLRVPILMARFTVGSLGVYWLTL